MKIDDLSRMKMCAGDLLDACISATSGFDDFLMNPCYETWRNVDCNHFPRFIHVASGMTRVVLIDDDIPFVLKICFKLDSTKIDFNQVEAEVYNEAKKRGVANHFAWIVKLFDKEVYGCDIYACEKCDMEEDALEERSYSIAYERFLRNEDLDDNEESRDRFECSSDNANNMTQLACEEWGEEEFFRVEAVLDNILYDKYGAGCLDLHSGNWGYRKEELVLTDYAGYGY